MYVYMPARGDSWIDRLTYCDGKGRSGESQEIVGGLV